MKLKIINDLALVIDNIVSKKYLSKIQEFLLSGAIFTDASQFLAMLIIVILVSELILGILINILGLPISVLILPLFVLP